MDTRMGCFDWSLREPFQQLSFAVLKTTVRVRNKKNNNDRSARWL